MTDFAALLRRSVDTYPDNVAVSFEGRTQTYAELGERAARLANALLDLGLQPGDRVAILGDNQLETMEQVAALAIAGLVRSPMYTMNMADTHAKLLNKVEAAAIIVQDRYAADVASIRDSVPSLRHVIVSESEADGADVLRYEELLAAASPEPPKVEVAPDADHIIRFSAGTTGVPKGIVHSVAGWMGMGEEFARGYPPFRPDDRYLAASPLSHAAGLMIWPVLAAGARYVVMESFDAAGFLDLIEKERCTWIMVVPTMITMLAEVPGARDRDLSSLRVVSYGASPITDRALRAGLALWGNVMYQSYGQSEALPATLLTPEYHYTGDSPRERRILASAGRPSANVTITIRDEEGAVLPTGEVGEICIKTPGAMKAIWGDPEATAERFTDDGSVNTRDMGYLDEEGFLHLVDRKEDMIISGGYNVWPLEVENALADHPDVVESAVVGIPDDKWGESVLAVVVLRDDSTVTEDELITFTREKVGPVKRPKRLIISRAPLPRNVVGKLLRRQVREDHSDPTPEETGANR